MWPDVLSCSSRVCEAVLGLHRQPTRDAEYEYWEWVKGTQTNANGNYTVNAVVPGSYRLGFADYGGTYVAEFFDDVADIDDAADVVVESGATVSGRNAALAVGGAISGTVSGPDGPLTDASATVYRSVDGYWDEVAWGYTDEDGTYRLGGLAAGVYRVGFAADGLVDEYWNDKPSVDAADDIAVALGGEVTGRDAELSVGATVKGKVTGPGGVPLGSIEVAVYRPVGGGEWDWFRSAQTNGNGVYQVKGLPAGTYKIGFHDWMTGQYLEEYFNDKLTIEAANVVTLSEGQVLPNRNAELSEGASIAGTVSGPSGPVEGVSVSAYEYDDYYDEWYSVGWAETDADGNYRMTRLLPGTYRLAFAGTGLVTEFWDDAATIETAAAITLARDQAVTGRNATLAKGATIRGKVTVPGGAPLRYVDVLAEDVASGETFWASTNAQGNYAVTGLRPGGYRLHFSAPWDDAFGGPRYASEYFDDAASAEDATVVNVSGSQNLTGRDAELAQAGRIGGRVTDSNGDPIENVWVQSWSRQGDTWVQDGGDVTDADGRYRVSGLAAGQHTLMFEHEDFATEYWNNKATLAKANTLNLAAGQTINNRNAELAGGGAITGQVTSAAAPGDVGYLITAYRKVSGRWTYYTSTYTGDGAYTLKGLDDGTYRVGFSSLDWEGCSGSVCADDLAPQYWSGATTVDTATNVVISGANTVSGIDGMLSDGGSISGKVTTTGGGLGQLEVTAYRRIDKAWTPVAWTRPAADGSYVLTGLADGAYRIGFDDPAADFGVAGCAGGCGGGSKDRFVGEFWNDKPTIEEAKGIAINGGADVTKKNAFVEKVTTQAAAAALPEPEAQVESSEVAPEPVTPEPEPAPADDTSPGVEDPARDPQHDVGTEAVREPEVAPAGP